MWECEWEEWVTGDKSGSGSDGVKGNVSSNVSSNVGVGGS